MAHSIDPHLPAGAGSTAPLRRTQRTAESGPARRAERTAPLAPSGDNHEVRSFYARVTEDIHAIRSLTPAAPEHSPSAGNASAVE